MYEDIDMRDRRELDLDDIKSLVEYTLSELRMVSMSRVSGLVGNLFE